MNLLSYLMSIQNTIGQFNVEEDHKTRVTLIRSTSPLTIDQKIEAEKLSPFPVKYLVRAL